MASNQDLLRIWKESKYSPPSSALLINQDREKKEVLLVVNDEGPILTLLNPRAEVVYLGKQRCRREERNYSCQGHLYSSPCLVPDPRIDFVKKQIFPLFYYKNVV